MEIRRKLHGFLRDLDQEVMIFLLVETPDVADDVGIGRNSESRAQVEVDGLFKWLEVDAAVKQIPAFVFPPGGTEHGLSGESTNAEAAVGPAKTLQGEAYIRAIGEPSRFQKGA